MKLTLELYLEIMYNSKDLNFNDVKYFCFSYLFLNFKKDIIIAVNNKFIDIKNVS